MWRAITPELLSKASGGKLPVEWYGTSKRNVDISEIRTKTTPVPFGNGKWALMFIDVHTKKPALWQVNYVIFSIHKRLSLFFYPFCLMAYSLLSIYCLIWLWFLIALVTIDDPCFL